MAEDELLKLLTEMHEHDKTCEDCNGHCRNYKPCEIGRKQIERFRELTRRKS